MKSGFVAIVGRPNVGKSTLINKIVGEKIAAVSRKAQTTRTRIMGVVTDENSQIIFMDTPGMHAPRTKLGNFMEGSIASALDGADVVLLMADVAELGAKTLQIDKLPKGMNIFLVINKTDATPKETLLPIIDKVAKEYDFSGIFPISAKKGDGIDVLLKSIREILPEGVKYFPDDSITDQPERVIISELVREKCMRLLGDEIPFGIAVEIEEFKLPLLRACIFCDKDSHKGIIIGKNGAKLKEIGTKAREDIERLLQEKVHLELWVKVCEGWRDNNRNLKEFGYSNK